MFGSGLSTGSKAVNIAGGLAVAGIAATLQSFKNAKNEAEKQKAITRIRFEFWTKYPGELGARLESQFRASKYTELPDVEQASHHYSEQVLYRYFFFRIDERFADALIARRRKLTHFDIHLEMQDLIARTLSELSLDQSHADVLSKELEEFQNADIAAFYENVRVTVRPSVETGKKLPAKQYDAIASQVEVKLGDRGVIMNLLDRRCVQIIGRSAIIFPTYSDYYNATGANETPVDVDKDLRTFFISNYLPKIVSTLYQRAE